MNGPDVAKCGLRNVVDLSLLMIRAAKSAGITASQAVKFLDALVAMPGQAASRIIEARAHEAMRRAQSRERARKR